ncbi:MAG: bifunctional 23S rRNA (guanine(2069)-N(7))-methyltransferase RlmK/23S rRNA (guanine(2445)-N(2))-methyltransferase RlmL [Candidatus Polarisedimenticolaceae bacterium]|nr:bifunctional 23S rRNA (guanine(2069)-N(7))-methyltransferase RlmK/23S rRNA (guanine(2445)-N(2))-methyltransferase RlmL [Candidatus Polarisedimenticolaceae bacterium]
MNERLKLYATVPGGMEGLLADELQQLGAEEVKLGRSGVGFQGSLETAYRICLWSRLANRLLLPLLEFPVETPEELYEQVRTIDWSQHMRATDTLAVDGNCHRSTIKHSHYAALKVKDAIVDQFQESVGSRPSVEKDRPELRIHLNIHKNQARLSLDLSGESLHRRGYRKSSVPAPLKENLAAAILIRAGWPEIAQQGGSLLDPMCGSATLPIEAAMMAGDVAPSLGRDYFGFLGWLQHDGAVWQQLIEEAEQRREEGVDKIPTIIASDVDSRCVSASRRNIAAAGFNNVIEVEQRDMVDCTPGELQAGLVVANPPYGERLGDEQQLIPLYREFGELLRYRFAGWHATLFSSNPNLQIGLKPERHYTLFNGPIRCQLSNFLLHQGKDEPRKEIPLSEGAQMLLNRLKKNRKKLASWIKREQISCYRLYDADLPEYSAAIDLFQSEQLWVHIQEYQAPSSIDSNKAGNRLFEIKKVVQQLLNIPAEQIFIKLRRKQRGTAQYTKRGNDGAFHQVEESGCKLLVNFEDYLDTGLFLDHRPIRNLIQQQAKGKRFLNLFAYTGAATIHAVVGGAESSTTIDMSKRYLEWAQENLALNYQAIYSKHQFIRADCMEWLTKESERGDENRRQYDLIFLDPPTFSNSKRMDESFDVQRDHVALIRQAYRLLAKGGKLYFSTNFRKFKLDQSALSSLEIKEITPLTIPPDFERNQKIHFCWQIHHAE